MQNCVYYIYISFFFTAVRAKLKRVRKLKLTCKKAKVLKGKKANGNASKLRRPVLTLEPPDLCCEEKTKYSQEMFLIMGHFRDSKLVPSFIMPWAAKRSKVRKYNYVVLSLLYVFMGHQKCTKRKREEKISRFCFTLPYLKKEKQKYKQVLIIEILFFFFNYIKHKTDFKIKQEIYLKNMEYLYINFV